MKHRALLLVGLVLAGCAVGPDYRRPELPVPADFRGRPPDAEGPSVGDLTWWQIFQDETLKSLIHEALGANYDVRIAAARILDARALLTATRSAQFPDVSANASAPYVYTPGERAPLEPRETFEPLATLDLSWELDLWGRLRRATEAARADLMASEDVQRFVITTLVSDLATSYFQLRELDLELEISRRTLTSRQDSLRLVRLRQEGGVAGLMDVRQSEVLLYTAAETIPDLERRIEQTENLISILLGRSPEAVPRGRPLLQQLALPAIPPGLPSSLLERRPDIRQAERQLAAATARIGVAKADYFPRVLLTGAGGAGGVWIDGSWFGPQGLLAIGPQINLPIFNAGRVKAGVESAEARAQEALVRYEQTVQQAFREVADALVEHRKRREFRVQQAALVDSLRDAARLANIRYRGGVTSYLEVLDTERQLFDAELALAQAQRDELLAVVRLYRALGGGWT
ncbi:MAG TPA: efflux transporter outer membrane subunit [Solirubrobacterales bacterium]|nr:efflux transporter outer membrane subunit [Solirubrobacterales bacterium]